MCSALKRLRATLGDRIFTTAGPHSVWRLGDRDGGDNLGAHPVPISRLKSRLIAARFGLIVLLAGGAAACSPTEQARISADQAKLAATARHAGQLFCAIHTPAGGAVVVGLINAAAVPIAGAAEPAVVIATGATKQFVDAACARAGGIAVSPPADPLAAPQVAIVTPTG
jgi:hypothetical protein